MQFLTFSIVGIVGTATHYAVLFGLVSLTAADPVYASMTGFIAGALVNYFLNYYITFKSDHHHAIAVVKFLSVAGVGLLLNTILMLLATRILVIHYLLGQVAATGTVLLWNYWGNRNWTFRRGNNELLQHK